MPSQIVSKKQTNALVNYSTIRRGDIYFANLSPVVGSEQGGKRPVLVIQNDIGNKYSPTVIIAAITSKIHKPKMPTHVGITKFDGVSMDSVILLEQIRTIDKKRLIGKVTTLSAPKMRAVDRALKISIGI